MTGSGANRDGGRGQQVLRQSVRPLLQRCRLGDVFSPLLIVAITLTAVLVSLIAFDVSPLLRGPAPWPPEWQWFLREEAPHSLRGLPQALGFCAVLVGLLFASTLALLDKWPRLLGGALLFLATLSSFGLQFAFVAMEDGRSATDVLVQRTVSPTFTSYYSVAVDPVCRSVSGFVREHANLLPTLQGHAATHPLGPILYYRFNLHVCEKMPILADAIIGVGRCLDVSPRLLDSPDRKPASAAAISGVLLFMMVSSMGGVAVAWLARAVGFTAGGAIRTAIVWAVVPGSALMVPVFDQWLVLPVVLSTALLIESFCPEASTLRRTMASGCAGLLGGMALFVSYGAVVFLAYGGMVALVAVSCSRPRLVSQVLTSVCIASGMIIFIFFVPSFFGHDSIGALKTALHIHRMQFALPRSYGAWVCFNLWDTVVFLGFPVAVMWIHSTATSAASTIRRGLWRGPSMSGLACMAATTGLLLLNFSGTVRGEAGRIWIPILPFLVVGALGNEPSNVSSNGPACGAGLRKVTFLRHGLLLLLLFECCLVLRRMWHLP